LSARPDFWEAKLLQEARGLAAVGVLTPDGGVRCPECGSDVPRSDGWFMEFACSCGWRLIDLELMP
jgi:hypothetical protein